MRLSKSRPSCIRFPTPPQPLDSLTEVDPPGDTLARHFPVALLTWYQFAVPDVGRLPLVERALEWLEENFPTEAATARTGAGRLRESATCSYDDFRPVAVPDWEMATVGPREPRRSVDHLCAHGVSGDRSALATLPGLPGVLRGRCPRDLSVADRG